MDWYASPRNGRHIRLDPQAMKPSYHVFGGPLDATGQLFVDPAYLADYRYAEVLGFGPRGLSWNGHIRRIAPDLGFTALGPMGIIGDASEERLFCDTGTSGWRERTTSGRSKAIVVQTDSDGVTFIGQSDVLCRQNAYNGVMRRVNSAASGRVSFTWRRYSTNWELNVYTGTDGGGVAPENITWSAATNVAPYGSGAASGTAAVDLAPAAPFTHLLIEYKYKNTNQTPTANLESSVRDLKVYGVPGVISTTPKNVIEAILADNPPAAYLRGLAYPEIADVGTAIEPLVFDDVTDAEQLKEVLRYQASRFAFISRLVALRSYMVPVYAALSDTAAYYLDLRDPDITKDIGGLDVEDSANVAVVRYSALDGSVRTLTRTNATSWLTTAGLTREISVDATATTSQTTAEWLGDVALAAADGNRMSGSVDTPYVRDAQTGVRVPLEHLACGSVCLLDGLGPRVTARLTEYSLDGSRALLQVDSSPLALDIALARLAKRKAA